MFADERKSIILEKISCEGNVYITDLAKKFNVSTETIRRDLSELSKEKKIIKVHGGAIAIKHPIREETYNERVMKNQEEKRRIGQYAAGLICDGDIVSFDYGASTEEIAKAIFHVKNITIITNSFNIATILMQKQQNGDFTGKIIFLGGCVDSTTLKTTGEIALTELNQFTVDKTFIGTTSISQKGFMMWNESEGEFAAAFSKNASETYVVADSSKFDKESFYQFLSFQQVHHIITDDENKISDQIKSAINTAKTQLHIIKNDKQ